MLLYHNIYIEQAVWACGHDPLDGKLYPEYGVCTGSTIALLYAWARDAQSIALPSGVGFEVGGDTGRKYMVVQVSISPTFYTQLFLRSFSVITVLICNF